MSQYRAYFVPSGVDPSGLEEDPCCYPNNFVGPLPEGARRKNELKIVIFDDGDRGNGSGRPAGEKDPWWDWVDSDIADGRAMWDMAKCLKGRGFTLIRLRAGDPFHNDLFPCACIKTLVIIDHGDRNGSIEFGDGPMTDVQIASMGGKLCPDAEVVLLACDGGKGATARNMMKTCKNIKTVWGSYGTSTVFGPCGLCKFDEECPSGHSPDFDKNDWDDVLPPYLD